MQPAYFVNDFSQVLLSEAYHPCPPQPQDPAEQSNLAAVWGSGCGALTDARGPEFSTDFCC